MQAIVIFLFLVACTKEDQDPMVRAYKAKMNQGVNIWSTVDYDIVRDKQYINRFNGAAHSLETPIMIRIFVGVENKGSRPAQSIQIRLSESEPVGYKYSTTFGGGIYGAFDKGKTMDYYSLYTFEREEDLNSFIKQVTASVTWVENGENKEMKLNLPAKPGQGNL
ncbi:hypothetical protein LJK88_08940 [Paenibacillus sp. P26]|nr:hypothetical protein LJK88_08940 [Paenibacillus sp. P26]